LGEIIQAEEKNNVTDSPDEYGISDMEWSHSRITQFVNCPYSFYLRYIEKNKNKEANYYAENGKLVHEILAKVLEGMMSGKCDNEELLDKALNSYINDYPEYVVHKVKKSTEEKTFELCSDYFATVDFDWLDGYEIVGVEKEVHQMIGAHKYLGYIDLLLRNKKSGKFVIVDHKSAAWPLKKNGEVLKSHEESFASYKRQMYLYADAVMKEYNVTCDSISELWWNHFKEGGKLVKIPFIKSEYIATKKWFTDTIRKIQLERSFPPKVNYFYCSNLCDYRNICEYQAEAKKDFQRLKYRKQSRKKKAV